MVLHLKSVNSSWFSAQVLRHEVGDKEVAMTSILSWHQVPSWPAQPQSGPQPPHWAPPQPPPRAPPRTPRPPPPRSQPKPPPGRPSRPDQKATASSRGTSGQLSLLICSWNLGVGNACDFQGKNGARKREFNLWLESNLEDLAKMRPDVILLQEVSLHWAGQFADVMNKQENKLGNRAAWCFKWTHKWLAILWKDFWQGKAGGERRAVGERCMKFVSV